MVDFKNDSNEVLGTLMLNGSKSIYRKSEVYSQLNYIREQVITKQRVAKFCRFVK